MDYDNRKCLIIAEAGVNHNGNLDLALKLCDAAKEAGADVIKFQTYKTEELITRHVDKASYQKENTGGSESQYEMLKRLELPFEAFAQIKEYCDKIGLIFCSTAHEIKSFEMLKSLGIPFAKVPSGDVGNVPFLRAIGSSGLPVILSTGMSDLEDIRISVEALKEGGAKDITILHCTTSYPCNYEDVNLRAMLTIKEQFGTPVGYSDHTVDCTVAVAAIAMGACVIEKHFTLDKNMEGPDHRASLNPQELKVLVDSIRRTETALGTGIKEPSLREREIVSVVTKRIVAKRHISIGSVISEDDICVKRNDRGRLARDWDLVVGSISNRDFDEDQGIE